MGEFQKFLQVFVFALKCIPDIYLFTLKIVFSVFCSIYLQKKTSEIFQKVFKNI